MDIFTLILASISTLILVWEFVIKNYYTRIEIKYYGPITDPGNKELGTFVPIIVKNKGFRKIKVTKIFLSYSNRFGGFYFNDYDFPSEIEAGNLKVFFVDKEGGGSSHIATNDYDHVYVEIDHRRTEYKAKRLKMPNNNERFDIVISLSSEYTLYRKQKLKTNPPKSQ